MENSSGYKGAEAEMHGSLSSSFAAHYGRPGEPTEEERYLSAMQLESIRKFSPETMEEYTRAYEVFGPDLRALIEPIETDPGFPKKAEVDTKDGKYEFFVTPEQRREIYFFAQQLSRHIKEGGISNLILMDRSVRPMHIALSEFWHAAYPDDALPNIFFVNPKGFKPTAEMTNRNIRRELFTSARKDDNYDEPKERRTREDIYDDFTATFGNLIKDNDKKTLLFDCCIHTGKEIKPVISMLEAAGFDDLEIGTIASPAQETGVNVDFSVIKKEPSKPCKPYDFDYLVEKTFDSVTSSPSSDEVRRDRGRRLRSEIKSVIQSTMANGPE